MYSVLGNHKTMTHRYTVNVIHIYRGIIVFTQQVVLGHFTDEEILDAKIKLWKECELGDPPPQHNSKARPQHTSMTF